MLTNSHSELLDPTRRLLVVLVACAIGSSARAQRVCFEADRAYDVGEPASALTTADLDGDGDPDIAVLNETFAQLRILTNDGTGELAILALVATGASPKALACADLDSDGDQDIAVACAGTNSMWVYANLGSGALSAPQVLPVGANPRDLCLADLDADGDVDIAVAEEGAAGVAILVNQGGGSFASATTYTVGTGPVSIIALDLDGDADLDLVTACATSSEIVWLANVGAGQFAPATHVPVAGSPIDVVGVDWDGDQDLELVVARAQGLQTSVVLANNGGGTLAPLVEIAGSWSLERLVKADLDGDGDLDVVGSSDSDPIVLTNSGTGSFTASAPIQSNTSVVADPLADLDRDGDVDLVVCGQAAGVRVLMNRGDGSFPGQPITATQPYYFSSTAADLDGDGRLDLVSLNPGVSVSRNLGGGSFSAPVFITPAEAFAVGDVDNDALLDLVIYRFSSSSLVSIYLNQGGMLFQEVLAFMGIHSITGVVLGDLDGDSDADAVTCSGQHSLLVNRNAGGGQFGPPTSYGIPYYASSVVLGDVDSDGDLDVLVGYASHFGVRRNDGLGNLSPMQTYVVAFASTTQLELFDADADGDLDVAALSRDTTSTGLEIWSNDGLGNFSLSSAHDAGWAPHSLTVGDLTGDQRPDIVATSGLGTMLYVNLGGGNFEHAADFAIDAHPAFIDVDEDGDLDWVSVPSSTEVRVHRNCARSGESVCSGAGPAAGCPCGNDAPIGATGGCTNSILQSARLVAHGPSTLSHDQLVLGAAQMVDSVAVFLQSSTLTSPAPFGDGLTCLGSPLLRLGTKPIAGGFATYPGPGDARVSVRGAVLTPGTRHYQVWYRDAANFCTSAVIATTNAWSTTWAL